MRWPAWRNLNIRNALLFSRRLIIIAPKAKEAIFSMKRIYTLKYLSFYVSAAVIFSVEVYLRYLQYTKGFTGYIFGDEGDGYFNLWLLEKSKYFWTHFDIAFLVRSNIFCPDGRLVLFWSDNLLAPGVVYSLVYSITRDMILSYNLLTYIMILLNFCIALFFFLTLAVIANNKERDIPFAFLLLIPWAAAVVVFSDTAMMFTFHFQNNFMPLILLGAALSLRIYYCLDDLSRYALPSVFVILFYATPYYAVGYALLCGVFAFFFLFSHRKSEIYDFVKKNYIYYALAGLAVCPVLVGYFKAKVSYGSQLDYGSVWKHILTPIAGSRMFSTLSEMGVPVKEYIHESLIYSGVFIFPLVALTLLTMIARFILYHKKEPIVLFLLVLSASSLGGYIIFPGWIRARFVVVLLILSCLIAVGVKYCQGDKLALYFIGLCMVLFAGFALGPSAQGLPNRLNPSVWGAIAFILPRTRSIRTVGRFGYIAFAFSIGFLVYSVFVWWRTIAVRWVRTAIYSVVFLAIILTIGLDQSIKPLFGQYKFFMLVPTEDEMKYFQQNPGLFYYLPADPWHYPASFMVYSAAMPEIRLVNGYSGRSSAIYDSIRQTIKTSFREDGLEILKKNGIRGAVFDKLRIDPKQLEEQKTLKGTQIVLENERYLIIAMGVGNQ
jgi:hypothetical protein